jgi:hypothetical protein
MSDTRNFLQAILDSMNKDEVKFGPKGKPRKPMSELDARKKAEREAYASTEEPQED